jgi:hypothetical protein
VRVPIIGLLQQSAFGPDEIDLMATAYEECLRILNLREVSDPAAAERLAKQIIEIAQTGVRDAARMRQLALKELGIPSTDELGTSRRLPC